VILLLLAFYIDRIALTPAPRPWEPGARRYSSEARGLAQQPVCTAVGRTVFHPDESNGIYPSYLWEHFIKGDFDRKVWGDNFWTVTQPPVMRYLIGMGRNLGGYGPHALTNFWDYNTSPEVNVQRGAMPGNELLWWARFPMVMLAAASFFMLFHILIRSFGRVVAYAALVLLGTNPYVQDSVCRAMTESPLVFSIMVAMAASICALLAWERGAVARSLAWVALAGAIIGWGAAAKLNAIVGVAAVAGLCGLAVLRKQAAGWRLRVGYVVAAGAIVGTLAITVFIGVNPYFYRHTADRIVKTLKNRVDEMSVQMKLMPDHAISGASQRAHVLKDRIFERFSPLRFRGAAWITIPLTLFGFLCMFAYALRWLLGTEIRAGPGVTSAVLLAFAVVVAGPTLMTPIDWDRYFLLPVLYCTMAMAVALGRLSQTASRIGRGP
jgi:4-amino-4-deoxy-L-arabinose transferase-like glycosyltransferase